MSENISQDIAISGQGNIVVGKGDVVINPPRPAEARLRHDLDILLKNVQNTWIKGVLEKSLHEVTLLDLGMELREEAVDNPWRMVVERPDQTRQTLPRGRKIKDIFYEANSFLLILGEPGSGKTTTLLQLARDLIAEVDQTFARPIPVILNLSTWANKQQPFDDWLIAELNSKYRLPKRDGQRWLEERRILPLLDGLDEVKANNRATCVEKINEAIGNYGLQGIAVCSRIKEYTNLNVRLAFYRAIYIQPLSSEQIEDYLNQAGDKLTGLRATLQADEALRSMAQSPLILNIMSLAYQNRSAESLINPEIATNKARHQHLFDTYITRMFNRKASELTYADEQTKHYLSWLSRTMRQHNQEVFLIEGLQPSWLSTYNRRNIYILVSRLFGVSLFGCGIYFLGLLSAELLPAYLLFPGLFIGLIDIVRIKWLSKQTRTRVASLWWSAINIVVVSIIIGLIYALIYGLGHRSDMAQDFSRAEWLAYSLDLLVTMISIIGLMAGLSFGLRGSKQTPEMDIETVEALRWSWPKAAKGSLIGVLLGFIAGLADAGFNFDAALRGMAIFASLGGIFNGLRREITETKSLPNEGIRLSIRNAILGGLIFGLGGGFAFGLNELSIDLALALSTGGKSALGFGLIGALWYGGLDVIQHYILRLFLATQGRTPAHYSRFLDYAVDRIFLQKVGGGYRFIHRLLLEHFADMSETSKG